MKSIRDQCGSKSRYRNRNGRIRTGYHFPKPDRQGATDLPAAVLLVRPGRHDDPLRVDTVRQPYRKFGRLEQ